MRVLFIGGTGVISAACTRLAAERGIELTLLNRGRSPREVPDGVELLRADWGDLEAVRHALQGREFDSVVDWIAFTPAHVARDIELFSRTTRQYVFISSASAYQTPPASLPVTESTPLSNPVWAYSRAKIACEESLLRAYREQGFPATLVRPSHTYDETLLPCQGGWTVIERMRRGTPVVVHGDGTSLWTLTHSSDFAKGFVPLLGHPGTLGEAFHITRDDALTWDQIYRQLGDAAGAEAKLVHVPSELIARHDRDFGDSLLGDKAHSMVFDNAKVKRFAPGFTCTTPFHQGARELIRWHDAEATRRRTDPAFDALNDELIRCVAG